MPAYLEVEFVVTLMRLMEMEFHVESGDMPLAYYFAAPAAWAGLPDAVLQKRVFDVAQKMYADLNKRFRDAEPYDLNYLRVKSASATLLTPDQVSSRPWLNAAPPARWEATPCVVVNADCTYSKVAPQHFADAAPSERDAIRLDRVLPVLVSKHLPNCTAAYRQLCRSLGDQRPLSDRDLFVLGTAVLFLCVLDRLRSDKDYPQPLVTVEEMVGWLIEDSGNVRRELEEARQLFTRMLASGAFGPGGGLAERIFQSAWRIYHPGREPVAASAFRGFIESLAGRQNNLYSFDFTAPMRTRGGP
jgi:hypothetical protein